MVRMARSRAWIAVLGTLLGGIVALNVVGLSLSSTVTQTAAEAERIEKENSLLREQISTVNTRRSARAAERASLAATAAAVEPAAETPLAAVAPPPEVASVETPPAEIGAAPAPVEPAEQAPSQAREDPPSGGSAKSAGGVGSP